MENDEDIDELFLSPTIMRYTTFTKEPKEKQHEELIKDLEQLLKTHKGKKRRVIKKFESKESKKPESVHLGNRVFFFFLNEIWKDLMKKQFLYETKNLQTLITLVESLLKMTKNNPFITINLTQFEQDTSETFSRQLEYRNIKNKREVVSRAISRIDFCLDQTELFNSIRRDIPILSKTFKENLMYSPPHEIDRKVAFFIIQSPMQKMIISIANFIAYGNPNDALYAIGEFANELYNKLQVNTETAQVIIYLSAIRFLFDESYVIASELSMFSDENIKFMKKCEQFCKQPAKALQLSNDIESYYTPGLPISALFKPKHCNALKQLEFLVNPIDIVYSINAILNQLAQFFGSDVGVLSFDDTLAMFVGLLSVSPPANTISIAKFIEKWNVAQLSEILRAAQNFYLAAVCNIMGVSSISEIVN